MAPADAFRQILCALDGEMHAWADKITSVYWFRKSPDIPSSAQAVAHKALEVVRTQVKEGDIRLRGELKTSDPPSDIDRAECIMGELNVFDQTLTIYAHGLTVARVYRRVFCVEGDVIKTIKNISKSQSELVRPAPPSVIHDEIEAVYGEVEKDESAPPNINKLADIVQPRLEARGYEVSKRQIKKIGKEFANRRGKVGKRLS